MAILFKKEKKNETMKKDRHFRKMRFAKSCKSTIELAYIEYPALAQGRGGKIC